MKIFGFGSSKEVKNTDGSISDVPLPKKSDKITYFNGQFVPHSDVKVHVDDRGFCFGDGIYEVVYFKNRKFVDFDGHINRFFRSLKEVNISLPVAINSKDALYEVCLQTLQQNQQDTGFIYLKATRGNLGAREHNAPPVNNPTFYISVSSRSQKPEWIENGIKVKLLPDTRWQRRDIKTSQLLPNVLAKQQALDEGFDDAVMVDGGIVTETTSANIFVVDDEGRLITHAPTNKILAGITRKRVITIAKDLGIEVIEGHFTSDFLLSKAKECFATNATLFLRPIVQVDNYIIGDGKVGKLTQMLIKKYNEFVDTSCEE